MKWVCVFAGLLLWNQTRERWVGKDKPNNPVDHNQGAKLK